MEGGQFRGSMTPNRLLALILQLTLPIFPQPQPGILLLLPPALLLGLGLWPRSLVQMVPLRQDIARLHRVLAIRPSLLAYLTLLLRWNLLLEFGLLRVLFLLVRLRLRHSYK